MTRPDAAGWKAPVQASADELNRVHADMRSRCPVAQGTDSRTGQAVWTVFRAADIKQATRDTENFSNGKRVRLAARRIPLESDPPEHGKLRRLLQPFFGPRQLQSFEVVTHGIVHAVAGGFVDNGGGDFAHEVARKLPTQVLLARLGQPISDWEDIKRWSEDTVPRDLLTADDEQRFAAGDAQLWAYSRRVVEDRLAAPRDPATDLLAVLLAAEVDGQPVDRALAVGCVRLLVAAGHDSTTQALGICVHYLARRPALQDELRTNPALIRPAIEEILRLESPVVAMPRIVARNVELHGHELATGDKLMLNWSSANHDSDQWADADDFRLDRGVNTHFAFGHGIHSCLGAPLARQEIRLTLELLLSRTRNFEISGDVAMMAMAHYGFERLPITLA